MKLPNVKTEPWDDDAPHQIRLVLEPHKNGVSCTCLRTTPKGANAHYEPMGYYSLGDMKAAWRIFNDPSNHQENAGEVFRAPVPTWAQDRKATGTTT